MLESLEDPVSLKEELKTNLICLVSLASDQESTSLNLAGLFTTFLNSFSQFFNSSHRACSS